MMEMPTPIVQHRNGEDHVDAFNDFLSINNPTQGIICSAYVTSKGMAAISNGLQRIAPVTDLYVGARNGVTSKQALMLALEYGMTPHIVDTGTPKFIFHYKFYYLANATHARTIVGSANLTGAGLEDNLELSQRQNYYFDDYGQAQVEQYLATTMEWIQHTREENVYQVTDEDHIDALVENRIIIDETHSKRRRKEGVDKKAEKIVYDVPVMKFEPKNRLIGSKYVSPTSGDVLIAQLGAGDRWKQANLPVDIMESFFGLEPYQDATLRLASVDENGQVLNVADTPVITARRHKETGKCRNMRIELDAVKGIPYPTNGRPIGVFQKCLNGEVKYKVYLPDESDYEALNKVLEDNYKGAEKNLKRVIVSSLPA